MGTLDGRVAIVTGGGRGLGLEHVRLFVAEGAKVVVNDLGDVAEEVAADIRAAGGEAIASNHDITSWKGGEDLVAAAVEAFGRLDVLVNNAGILRDRMLVNMSEAEWDAVIQVHLKGTFGPSRHAAAHWRERVKAGEPAEAIQARIINTTSVSGIYGNPGQTNYGAAKSGIASFTIIASRELGRYGVTVNAVAPGALTRLTAPLMGGRLSEEEMARQSPRWIAPIVTWLASTESGHVTGRVFEATPDLLGVAETWRRGPTVDPIDDPTKLGPVVADLLGRAAPNVRPDGRPEQP